MKNTITKGNVKRPFKSGAKITRSEVDVAVSRAGGATLTKKARKCVLKGFFEILKFVLNIQIRSFQHVKVNHICQYIACRIINEGIDKRTAQNNMSHIRQSLRAMGRNELADSVEIGNKALQIDNASRNGTHKIPSPEFVIDAITKVERKDIGAACCLKMQRFFGLRAQEAVQSPESLEVWLQALDRNITCQITHGTKTGRVRDFVPLDTEQAKLLISDALGIIKERGGYLIESKNLKAATYKYWRICANAGLVGVFGSHCFRCAYALDRYKYHYAKTGSISEALSATSIDLGHGDGRGRYIKQVYLYEYFEIEVS